MLLEEFRTKIERKLGRQLTIEEVAPQPALDKLSEPVLGVARAIRAKNQTLCVAYLAGLVPGLRVSEISTFIETLPED